MLSELRNLPAPAKLNLFLHVTGRRADGYHLLETVFQFIDLQDSIDLRLREDGKIARVDEPEGIPVDQDLTLRAATALQSATGCRLGVDIGLRKRIPIGAGLGGGSSDAATVLLGLDRLWGLKLGTSALIEIARPLGSDVPVFVYGRNAYATGIGDRFRPIRLPQRWFVLVMPPVSVATPGVFSAPDLTRDTRPIKITGFSKHVPGLAGRNDLQPVVLARQPAVKRALDALLAASTRGGPDLEKMRGKVRMTGSGSCVFAAEDSLEEAQDTALRVLQHNVGSVQVVSGLAKHPLGSSQVG